MKSTVLLTFAATAAALALTACSDDRTATAETSVAEAEVTTDMPDAAVTDAQLEAAANQAVATASQPQQGSMTPMGETPPSASEQ
ncbi:MAG: hypothetical protein KKG14_11490 [Alphaproteobacteria bacterium]|nr:hypothetical protein [Alphaproteobacteria bacterium]MBU2271349.1 hypothetical protein [Alphaproteobacteria bacterium]MBU2419316.1 hypothetical protein [Alphaproteobacteria bacterium]